MPDNTNLVVSLLFLQNRGIPPETAVPAAIGASLIPGMLGLILPLAIANGTGGSTTSTSGSETLVRVPDVTGMSEDAAKRQLEDKKLVASTQSAFLDDAGTAKGDVFEQDPEADGFVSEGSTVTITVSLGPKPDDGNETEELDTIRKDVEENTKKIEENSKKLDQVLDAINKSMKNDIQKDPKRPLGTSG